MQNGHDSAVKELALAPFEVVGLTCLLDEGFHRPVGLGYELFNLLCLVNTEA